MLSPLAPPESSDRLTAVTDRLVPALLGWWASARAERDLLPWRSTRDPWAILVAETMLAQTTVGRAAGRFPDLLAAFPSPEACAVAPVGDVLRCWSGLGYNRRAVALHGAARQIVSLHGGVVPARLADLLALPGVGPYTARAVLATAFDLPAAVVDTNVGRVLARAVAGRALGASEAQRLADDLLPPGASREWNLALMDFGSLVCRARPPLCDGCALRDVSACAWRGDARASGAGSVSGVAPRGDAGAFGDDPARGSAAVSTRQARFAGSDREGRGRLVRAACAGPVPGAEVASTAGWPGEPERALRVAAALVAEGVLVRDDVGTLSLP